VEQYARRSLVVVEWRQQLQINHRQNQGKHGRTQGQQAPEISDRLWTTLSTARYFVFLSQGM